MNEKQLIEWIENAVKLKNDAADEVQETLKNLEATRKWLVAPENLLAAEAETDHACSLRADTIVESLTNTETLQNAPAVRDCQIVLPRVIAEE